MKDDIRNLSFEELDNWIKAVNEPKYRASQIFRWLYRELAVSFNDMKNLPGSLIKKLEDTFVIYLPAIKEKLVSVDGTTKYLLRLTDEELIEMVIIPSDKRLTICISTQVGCRYSCRFCASGLYGFKRNLSQSEILAQLITAKKEGHKVTNIVFMGIGEPLDNYDNLIKAIKIINDESAFKIGARKITISTAGIPEKIDKLSGIGLQIELSISLHTADNKKRDMLMPINKLFPIVRVLESVKKYYEKTNRIVTFEYVFIKDVNDSNEDAEKLIRLLKDIACKVNLIPYSPSEGMPFDRPEEAGIKRFKDALDNAGIPVTVRSSKGIDISAACGQLRIRN